MALASYGPAGPWTRESVYLDTSQVLQASMLGPENYVQRWDGNARTATEWNSLRRDTELWFEDGHCYVYLYQPGQSLRGPSFRVPIDLLVDAECNDLLDDHLISSSCTHGESTPKPDEECFLYLPAPSGFSRDRAYQYHLDTRNFFAWLVGAPIVGTDPALALARLKDRLDVWRDPLADNMSALFDYIRGQGYADGDQSLEKAMNGFSQPARPMLRKRTQSFKGWFRRPTSTWRASKVVDSKKRTSILSFASPFNRVPESAPVAPVIQDDEEYFDEQRASTSWSESSPPQLSHSRDASIESFYSSDFVSSSDSPTTPHSPHIPSRSSSFYKTGNGAESGTQKQGRLHIRAASEDQHDPIQSLIHEIEESGRPS